MAELMRLLTQILSILLMATVEACVKLNCKQREGSIRKDGSCNLFSMCVLFFWDGDQVFDTAEEGQKRLVQVLDYR